MEKRLELVIMIIVKLIGIAWTAATYMFVSAGRRKPRALIYGPGAWLIRRTGARA